MPAIRWDPSMLTGIRAMDDQHMVLTEMLNDLYYAYMDGRDADILASIITGVSDYTTYHFSTEEKLMADHGYADMAAHMAEHREFQQRAIDFLIGFVDHRNDLTSEVVDYLTDWWVSHICGTDRKLAAALGAAGEE